MFKRRRPGDSGSSRRLGPRGERDVLRVEERHQPRQEAGRVLLDQVARGPTLEPAAGIDRVHRNRAIAP